jgi:hypothetical protein
MIAVPLIMAKHFSKQALNDYFERIAIPKPVHEITILLA